MAEMDRLADSEAFSAASVRFETVTSPAMASEIDSIAKTPSSRSREWYQCALRNFQASPGAFTLRLIRSALV
jgi:hypothetical protein